MDEYLSVQSQIQERELQKSFFGSSGVASAASLSAAVVAGVLVAVAPARAGEVSVEAARLRGVSQNFHITSILRSEREKRTRRDWRGAREEFWDRGRLLALRLRLRSRERGGWGPAFLGWRRRRWCLRSGEPHYQSWLPKTEGRHSRAP